MPAGPGDVFHAGRLLPGAAIYAPRYAPLPGPPSMPGCPAQSLPGSPAPRAASSLRVVISRAGDTLLPPLPAVLNRLHDELKTREQLIALHYGCSIEV